MSKILKGTETRHRGRCGTDWNAMGESSMTNSVANTEEPLDCSAHTATCKQKVVF